MKLFINLNQGKIMNASTNQYVIEAQAREKANLEPKIQYFNEDPHEESSHIEKLFWGPVSVLLDNEERLFITETNRHRIQVYEKTK